MMKTLLAISGLIFALSITAASVTPAQARTLTFMNSQGYQTQLAQSRKAYADSLAAQSAPKPASRPARKKKSN